MGQDKSPQALGSPSGVSLNPRSSLGSCSQHPPPPNPKAHSPAAGDVSPLKPLRAPKSSSQLPFLLFLQPLPPAPAAPRSPQPLAGTTPQGAQGAGGVCRGCQAAASWAGSPSHPRPPQGQDVHPTPQDVTLLPIPPSPEPSSAPRMSLALGGPGTIPCAGSWESTGKPQVGNSL